MTPRTTDTDRSELLDELLAELTGDEKHAASAHSTLDVLRVLFERVLRLDPADPADPDRDRFLLSKGHGPAAYYAVLVATGHLDRTLLRGLAAWDSPLGHHPDRLLVPGVEISSGSLGHGLPIAVGRALALRALGKVVPRVVVLLGDAELDEGSNHEAIALAGRLGLDRLVAVVVDNRSATHGWPRGIEQRFAVEGWTTAVADGRDHDALEKAFGLARPGCPHVVVAVVEERV
jgi:transketolase